MYPKWNVIVHSSLHESDRAFYNRQICFSVLVQDCFPCVHWGNDNWITCFKLESSYCIISTCFPLQMITILISNLNYLFQGFIIANLLWFLAQHLRSCDKLNNQIFSGALLTFSPKEYLELLSWKLVQALIIKRLLAQTQS